MNTEVLDEFTSRRSTVYGSEGAIATSQPLAATAGLDVMREGGNAFDAGVAAAAALNVVEPTSTGIGGDVFALYRTAGGEVGAMRSCGGAPANATIDAVRDAVAGTDMPFRGPHTVTVPGTARGWEALIDQHGARPLGELLQPAIDYATDGFPVSPVVADQWRHGDEIFTEQHARDVYLSKGRAPRTGEVVTLRALGDSLRTIAQDGAAPLYTGSIADAIVTEVQDHGGFMSHADLADFQPEFIDPIAAPYQDATIYQLPPNNQGLIVLEALRIAASIDATDAPPGSVDRVHAMVEAMKRAFHDGHRFIADPEYTDVPPLADDQWVRDRANSIDDQAASNPALEPPDARAEHGDTVMVSVADGDGNVVSLINSRFAGFGSGLVAGETGIALQNRGASFSLDPSDPNHLEPGKRPFHTLIPALVQFDADDWAAFGVMGGTMQPQGQMQILTRLIADAADPQRALDAPRWRYLANGRLAVEARMDPVLQSALVRRGHDIAIQPPNQFGGAQFVRKTDDRLVAASEPRKDGQAVTR